MKKVKKISFPRLCLGMAFCLFAFAFLSACESESRTPKKSQQDSPAAPDFEASLVFNDVTLEQADPQGHPLWKVKAKQAAYSKDKKNAKVQNPIGDLFQDGKLVLKVSAQSGEVQEDGQKILLKGQIVATDPRNGAVFRGNEVEWRPKEDLLLVRDNLKGTHEKTEVSAGEGRYLSRKQQVELFGKVVGTSKDPALQIKTEHAIWQIPQKLVIGDQRLQIDRYTGTTVTDQAVGDQSEVNLATKTAKMKQNVELASIDPPVQIASNSVIWNFNTRTVVSDQPVRIVNRQEQVTLTANRGQVDLERNVAVATGGAQGMSTRNQAKLYANQITWEIPTQQLQADGNVIYQQVDPPLNLNGSKAFGRLDDQTITITGGSSGGRVVTEIVP